MKAFSDREEKRTSEGRSLRWFDDFTRDAKYAFRSLRRAPAFAAVVTLTVALGTGANTAVFTVLYNTLLAPLPYSDPNRLVEVKMVQAKERGLESGTSMPNLLDWIAQSNSFEGLAVHRPQFFTNLSGRGEAEEVHAWRVSARMFPLLGVPPEFGRWFVLDEDSAAGPRSALISHQLLQNRFGGDSDIVGKEIFVDGEAFKIVGVMPSRFEFPPLIGTWKPLLWLSLNLPLDKAADRSTHSLNVIGRLKPGVPIERPRQEMEVIAGRLAKAYPQENSEWTGARVSALSQPGYVREFRSTLWLLTAASGLVLLIACANVAGLLIARNAAREREDAIRIALGVSASRLMRQVLTESFVISAIGCCCGVILAFWSLPALKSMLAGRPRIDEIAIRPAILAFSAGMTVLTTILFGMWPALQAIRPAKISLHVNHVRSARQPFRRALVTIEIAVGLVLLSAAGLLVESLWRVTRADLGFRPDRILSMRFDLTQRKYDTGRRVEAFRTELLRKVSALPGVEFAGTNSAPPMGVISQNTDFTIEGESPGFSGRPSVSFSNVSSDYLRAMGIKVLRGRNFGATDKPGSPLVAIISQTVARSLPPGEELIGSRIRLGRLKIADWFTVIGVVQDVREGRPESPPAATIYALSDQLPEPEQGGVPQEWSY